MFRLLYAQTKYVNTSPSSLIFVGYTGSGTGVAAFFNPPKNLRIMLFCGHHVMTSPVAKSYSVPSSGTRIAAPDGPSNRSPSINGYWQREIKMPI